jgi:hypothetical protein
MAHEQLRSTTAALLALLAVPGLLAVPQAVVIADTHTVGVQVRFVERIEITRAAITESLRAPGAYEVAAKVSPSPATAADGRFVTALRIEATPRRAVTLQVDAADSRDAGGFVCSYGRIRKTPCSGTGLSAVSLTAAELTIERSPDAAAESGSETTAPTQIEVTITYH